MSTYLFELAISVNGISKGNDEGNKLLQLAKKCPKVTPNVIFICLKAKNEVQKLFQEDWCLSWLKFFPF
jgi:hypothetical protein